MVYLNAVLIGFGDYTDLRWWKLYKQLVLPLGSGIAGPFKWTGNHTYLGLKNNWGMQSKMVFKMCEGIFCSSFSVKELKVIVHEK